MNAAKTPLILAAIICSLGGLAYWDDWQSARTALSKKQENRVFNDNWSPTTLEYQRREDGTNTHIIAKKAADGSWLLTQPIAELADQQEIIKLWETVRDYQFEKVVSQDLSNSQTYGLNQPYLTILAQHNGASFRVDLGNKTPLGYGIYLNTSRDSRILVGSQFIVPALSKSIFDLRNKAIAIFKQDEVRELTYQSHQHPQFTLAVKNSGSTWTLAKPETLELNPNSIVSLLNTLQQERSIEIIDQPSSILESAILNPQLPAQLISTITWQKSASEATTLRFIDQGEAVIVSRVGQKKLLKLSKEAASRFGLTRTSFFKPGPATAKVQQSISTPR